MIKLLYNRCTIIYKFGNNTYPQRIRRRSTLGHIFHEKLRLMGREIRYIYVSLQVYVFVILFYERNWTVILNYDVTAVPSVIFSTESFQMTTLF